MPTGGAGIAWRVWITGRGVKVANTGILRRPLGLPGRLLQAAYSGGLIVGRID